MKSFVYLKQNLGIRIAMLTGDSEAAASVVHGKVNLKTFQVYR